MSYKLFYVLIGCTPAGRHTEQHDVYFGIAQSLKELIPQLQAFWPDAGKIHIDAWREVSRVDGFAIEVITRDAAIQQEQQLYFVNLGGYLPGQFEEHHHKMLCVAPSMGQAIQKAKQSDFYKEYTIKATTAQSHVDDKFGVDVDEVLDVAEILPGFLKEQFFVKISKKSDNLEDELHIGYTKLSSIK